MENKIKKTIGIILCIIFGVFLLSTVVSQFIYRLGILSPSISMSYYAIANLIIAASAIFIGIKKEVHTQTMGKIGAFGTAGLSILFFINQISYVLTENSLIYFTGFSLISAVVQALFMGLLLFSLKTWLPTKILGISTYIPEIISGFIYMKLDSLSDFIYWHKIDTMLSAMSALSIILYIATIILIIIGMNLKSEAPSFRAQQIDMI